MDSDRNARNVVAGLVALVLVGLMATGCEPLIQPQVEGSGDCNVTLHDSLPEAPGDTAAGSWWCGASEDG